MDSLPTMGSELSSKRKAAQAAVHAAAQALAQDDAMDDEGFGMDDGGGPPTYMPTLPNGMQTSAATPQVAAPGLSMGAACAAYSLTHHATARRRCAMCF